MRALNWVQVALLTVPFMAGCASSFDSKSGGDNTISTAQSLALSQPVTDRVSNRTHDNVDWKSFTFDDQNGRVHVDVYWDNPKVQATISVYDQMAQKITSLTHQVGQQRDRIANLPVREGRYFVVIRCIGHESVYTLEVLDSAGGNGSGGSSAPPPI
tara:strand:- start:5097 stop:5567 length:471 start_codon:yes stop_codon:yes gene_type:complete